MGYRTIQYGERDNVGTIKLNRPEKRNAINETLIEELVDCINYCSGNNDTKSIILTGNGKAFCSGGEIVEKTSSGIKGDLGRLHAVLLGLRRVPKPVIAAVNGPAVGAGFALALFCDVVIAAKSARFSAQHVFVGMSPDCGLSHLLPRLLGDKRATWLMFTGEMVDAQKGYELGFVNQVAEDDQLLNQANAVAGRLAESATLAIAATKELINLSWNQSLETQMECERQSLGRLVLTEDHNEAVVSFREKRKPEFKGR
jgi:2-(1,2-epoxy-1,2-dihydrophenyl)acetyl-CoA isomerase